MINRYRGHCYSKLKFKSTCRERLFRYATEVDDWSADIGDKGKTFLQKRVPIELIEDDSVVAYLEKTREDRFRDSKFGAIRIYKMEANTFYRYHRDNNRMCSVNMLLNEDCESLTFFNVGEFRENQTHIFNLNYELDTYYLLNIQVPHAVVNLNQDRYY